ncbi:15031_t:CDS:2, partial [Acaulospora morrowiae]
MSTTPTKSKKFINMFRRLRKLKFSTYSKKSSRRNSIEQRQENNRGTGEPSANTFENTPLPSSPTNTNRTLANANNHLTIQEQSVTTDTSSPLRHYNNIPTSLNNFIRHSKIFRSTSTSSPASPVPIKLNVGGILYVTTQQTLCSCPSYLSELFFLFQSPNSTTYASSKSNLFVNSNNNRHGYLKKPASRHPQIPWPEELFIDRD